MGVGERAAGQMPLPELSAPRVAQSAGLDLLTGLARDTALCVAAHCVPDPLHAVALIQTHQQTEIAGVALLARPG